MIFAIPEEVSSFNLDAVWVIIGIGFLIYVFWMLYMAFSA